MRLQGTDHRAGLMDGVESTLMRHHGDSWKNSCFPQKPRGPYPSKLDIEQRPEGGVCGKMLCWTTAPIWSLAKPLQDPDLNIHAPECIKPGCELTSLFLFRTVLEISANKLVYGIRLNTGDELRCLIRNELPNNDTRI